MSDTGFTKFTSFFRGDSGGPSSARGESESRILTLPAELRAEKATMRAGVKLRGEVVQENTDRSVRVRTERGDIDIRPPEGRQTPKRGDQVEIDIRPAKSARDGAQPRADIRVIKDAPQPPQRSGHTPVEVRIESASADESSVRRAAQKLQQEATGALVRAQKELARFQSRPAGSGEAQQQQAAQNFTPQPAVTAGATQSGGPEASAKPAAAPPAPSAYYMKGLPAEGALVRLLPTSQGAAFTQAPIPDVQAVQPSLPAMNAPVLTDTAQGYKGFFTVPKTSAPLSPALSIAPQAADMPLFLNAQSAAISVPISDDGSNFTLSGAAAQGGKNVAPQQMQPALPPAGILQTADPTPNSSTAANASEGLILSGAHNPSAKGLQALDVRISKILPPETPLHAPAAPPVLQGGEAQKNVLANLTAGHKAGEMAGVITGVSTSPSGTTLPTISVFFPQSGETLLFALQSPADAVTIGARVHLSPQSVPSLSGAHIDPAAPQAAALPPLPVLAAPGPWPLMEEVQQTLMRAAPQAAQVMNAVMPSANNPAQMGPALMFFVAAVRGGDLGSWMGERGVEALSKSNKGLLSRLLQEGQTLGRAAAEVAQNDWRAVNVPLVHQEQVQKLALYYRHEKDEAEDAPKGARGTRFVFDLALDHMGKVQVDGLFRPVAAEGKRLDLIVRTEQSFAEDTRAQMRRIYTDALKSTDVHGSLDFQDAREGWVTIKGQQERAMGMDA